MSPALSGQSVRLAFKLLLQHGGRKSDRREILANFVVEISSDALLFAFANGDDLLFQLLSALEEFESGADIIPLLLEGPPGEHDQAEIHKTHDRFPKP